jgi:hypothetical protein
MSHDSSPGSCGVTNAKGLPCKHPGVHADGKCWYHSIHKDEVKIPQLVHGHKSEFKQCGVITAKDRACIHPGVHPDGKCWYHSKHRVVNMERYERRKKALATMFKLLESMANAQENYPNTPDVWIPMARKAGEQFRIARSCEGQRQRIPKKPKAQHTTVTSEFAAFLLGQNRVLTRSKNRETIRA